MHEVYLGLGSNIGDTRDFLHQAVALLNENPQITVSKKSSLYQTKPVGEVEQDDFLNAVVMIETDLAPNDLLDAIHEIERTLHRKREIHWGPRTIDIDILFYDDEILNEPDLIVPHPEIPNRAFVLVPLMEIATEKLKQAFPVVDWLQARDDKNDVQKIDEFDQGSN